MKALRCYGVAAWLGALASAQSDPVTIELRVTPAEPFVAQPCELTIELAYDTVFFAEHGVPMLQRRLDLPFVLELPWPELHTAVQWREAASGPRLVIGEREVRATRLGVEDRDGRAFERIEVRADWSPVAPGDVTLASAVLRYAHTSRFEQTLLGGRQPVDRQVNTVGSAAVEVRVRDVPVEGRPADYTGAVGDFTVRAEAPAVVEVGDSFTLALVVSGRGNLHEFAAPSWPRWPGFAVQGLVEQPVEGGRRFEFDVLALRAGAILPPFSLPYFEPDGGVYRRATSAAVSVRASPRRPDRPLSERVRRLIAATEADAGTGMPWWSWALIAGAMLGAALLWLRRRR